MTLEIHSESSSDATSSYRLGHHSKAVSCSDMTKEDIKKATMQMLRTLISMASTLKVLPSERTITMKLFYYDEITPVDYEPKFFKSASNGK